jgi:hypothetical protein
MAKQTHRTNTKNISALQKNRDRKTMQCCFDKTETRAENNKLVASVQSIMKRNSLQQEKTMEVAS